jgi:hypothetical protein
MGVLLRDASGFHAIGLASLLLRALFHPQLPAFRKILWVRLCDALTDHLRSRGLEAVGELQQRRPRGRIESDQDTWAEGTATG